MCQFKSALVIRDAKSKGGHRVLLSPWTESHSELCKIFKIRDDAASGPRVQFARVEFTPKEMARAYLPEEYTLRIDEERRPDWFDEEMFASVEKHMRDYIARIVINDHVELAIGGQYIVGPKGRIDCAKEVVFNAICGGTISNIWGGTISDIWGGTISNIWGGTISNIWGGTISNIWGGTISNIRGGTISDIWGGTISDIWGGTISNIRGGTIGRIHSSFTKLLGRIKQEYGYILKIEHNESSFGSTD